MRTRDLFERIAERLSPNLAVAVVVARTLSGPAVLAAAIVLHYTGIAYFTDDPWLWIVFALLLVQSLSTVEAAYFKASFDHKLEQVEKLAFDRADDSQARLTELVERFVDSGSSEEMQFRGWVEAGRARAAAVDQSDYEVVAITVNTRAPFSIDAVINVYAAILTDVARQGGDPGAVLILDGGLGSWWLKVGVPLASLALSSASLTNDIVANAANREKGSFEGLLDSICKPLIEREAERVTIVVGSRPVVSVDCAWARERELRKGEREARATAGQAEEGNLPATTMLPDTRLFVHTTPAHTPRSMFEGRIAEDERLLVEAPAVASYAFPIIDIRVPPGVLRKGGRYKFDGMLRMARGKVVVGAYICDAIEISES